MSDGYLVQVVEFVLCISSQNLTYSGSVQKYEMGNRLYYSVNLFYLLAQLREETFVSKLLHAKTVVSYGQLNRKRICSFEFQASTSILPF